MANPRRMLVTSALPYANGSIHIGHLVEYIQTDIWVRFQKMRGHECYFICASDAHGTPIMLRAEQEGIEPAALVERVHAEHARDFSDFEVAFDNFYTTHSPENTAQSQYVFRQLEAGGYVTQRSISQFYDPQREMFLPDRYIKGDCPRCGAQDQYGDNCEDCGATYAPEDLANPRSAVSGSAPVKKDTDHFFVRLGEFQDTLKSWCHSGALQSAVANKLDEWFETGLRDWDVTRDAPYFGIEIPDHPGKYFYVWLDAPIGYMASFKNLCQRSGIDFDAFWAPHSTAEVHHFIGKDILYFHSLFWPAMLHGAGFRTPTAVHAHGFLTVDGKKMSKSRGTFIRARTYLDHLQPDYLRYYYAAKLGAGIDDIDLNLEDFVARVNADLVGKVVNIASRCAGFINKRFAGRLATTLAEPDLFRHFAASAEAVALDYERREYARAMRNIMKLADEANRYIDEHKPWVLAKDPKNSDAVQGVCTQGLNLFKQLITMLKPVLPATSRRSEAFLDVEDLDWNSVHDPLLEHNIKPFTALLKRVEEKTIAAISEQSRGSLPEQAALPSTEDVTDQAFEAIATGIDIDAFSAVDLRVARIVHAEALPEARKLIKLTLDIGSEQRTVFAGIKSAYKPESLIGRLTVMVANLQPRKMRFGVSEGMLLAAGPGGKELFLLSPDSGAQPGMRVT